MDLSWSELLVIGIVALIIIGPKDLPGMFRELGRFTAKLRSMGRDFSRAMEQAAKDTGMNEVAADLRKVTSPKAMGLDAVRTAADKFEKWDPLKPAPAPAVQPLTPPPMPPTPAAAPAAAAAETAVASPSPAVTATGPATQALVDKQAARKAILDEMNAKLKALDEAPPAPAEAQKRAPGRVRSGKDDGA